ADLQMEYFGTSGSLNDRKSAYFDNIIGGDGALADLEYQFYSDLELQLDAIAGEPAGLLTAPGDTGPLDGFTALGPRSLYVAYRIVDTPSGFNAIAQLATSAFVDGLIFSPSDNSTNGLSRADAPGGST